MCVDRQDQAMEAADVTGDRGSEPGKPGCVCVGGGPRGARHGPDKPHRP